MLFLVYHPTPYPNTLHIYLHSVCPSATTSAHNTTYIKWSDMSTYLETIGRKVVEIPSTGKSLLLAIRKCLEVDFDIKRNEKNIACKIWKELKIMELL